MKNLTGRSEPPWYLYLGCSTMGLPADAEQARVEAYWMEAELQATLKREKKLQDTFSKVGALETTDARIKLERAAARRVGIARAAVLAKVTYLAMKD